MPYLCTDPVLLFSLATLLLNLLTAHSLLLPLFLHVAAFRSRACWILLAPTHQLLTLPCPLEFHPPFSGTARCLDTPAVGSPMMTRACWIRLAPTHQLSTLPCPLELHPPFSGTTRSLDTPAVGSPMMCCLPYAHKLGCLRLGRSRQEISTPLTKLSLLPPPPIFACGCGVNVP